MRQKRAIKELYRIRKIYNSRMKWGKWMGGWGGRDRYLGRIVDVSGAHKVAIVVAH